MGVKLRSVVRPGFVSAWVTLLYAVGLRMRRGCKHWPEWFGEPRLWARFERGAAVIFGFIQTIVHAADDPVRIEGNGGD